MVLLLVQPVRHVLLISSALCHDGTVSTAAAINRRAPGLLLDLDLDLRQTTALGNDGRAVLVLMLHLTFDHRVNCRWRRLFDDRAGPGARTDDAGADRAGLIAGHNPLRRVGRNIPSAGSTERRQNISLY
jgi:hypothetical protein